MRCRITRPGKLRRFAELIGKPVRKGVYRGNTGGRIDIVAIDGSVYVLWPDGTLTESSDHYYDGESVNIFGRKTLG